MKSFIAALVMSMGVTMWAPSFADTTAPTTPPATEQAPVDPNPECDTREEMNVLADKFMVANNMTMEIVDTYTTAVDLMRLFALVGFPEEVAVQMLVSGAVYSADVWASETEGFSTQMIVIFYSVDGCAAGAEPIQKYAYYMLFPHSTSEAVPSS